MDGGCLDCGTLLEQGRGRPRVRCPDCAKRRNRAYKIEWALANPKAKPPPKPERQCVDCGIGLGRAKAGTPRQRCADCGYTHHLNVMKVYRDANKDRATELTRAWIAKNPERKRKNARDWAAQSRAANPGLHADKQREWREANRDRAREWSRQWYASNTERCIGYVHRRRARIEGNGLYAVTDRDLARLLARQHSKCAYCRCSLEDDKHLDHVVPLARGGRHSIGNLAWACPRCNLSKNVRLLADFRRDSRVMI